jgi:hypothetical protein
MSTSFYKIAKDQPITFGWNYTSLYVTPQHLTISAFCSQNGNRYPVGASDGVVPGNATQVVWDVYSYNQANQVRLQYHSPVDSPRTLVSSSVSTSPHNTLPLQTVSFSPVHASVLVSH